MVSAMHQMDAHEKWRDTASHTQFHFEDKNHSQRYQCTWKGCRTIHYTVFLIEAHIREAHLGPKKPRTIAEEEDPDAASDHEEDFYYTELEDEEQTPSPPSPPTLSHRDMARPPHEDPEYQRKLVGDMRQGLLSLSSQLSNKSGLSPSVGPINIPTSPLARHNYAWAPQSPVSPQKHVRLSPRPSTSFAPYPSPTFTHAIATAQHNVNVALGKASPNAPTSQHGYQPHRQPSPHIQNNRQVQLSPHTVLHVANNNNNSQKPNQNISPLNLSQSVQPSQQTSVIKSLHQEQTAAMHQHQLQQQQQHQQQHHQQQQQQQHNHQRNHIPQPSPPHPKQPKQSTASPKVQQLHQHEPQQPPQQPHPVAHQAHQTPPPSDATSAAGAPQNQQGQGRGNTGQSPTRRQRGENKKCRKVYGMDHKELWCTQCKWKKACSRFGE